MRDIKRVYNALIGHVSHHESQVVLLALRVLCGMVIGDPLERKVTSLCCRHPSLCFCACSCCHTCLSVGSFFRLFCSRGHRCRLQVFDGHNISQILTVLFNVLFSQLGCAQPDASVLHLCRHVMRALVNR